MTVPHAANDNVAPPRLLHCLPLAFLLSTPLWALVIIIVKGFHHA